MNDQTMFAEVIAKAWADGDFKARLVADPAGTLAAEGIELPPGLKLNVIADAPGTATFVIPPPPADGEISEEHLGAIAGGMCSTYWDL
jgi:hypothetical protein